MNKWICIVPILALGLLTGCSHRDGIIHPDAGVKLPTSLEVTRAKTMNGGQALGVTIRDATLVQSLYHDLQEMPAPQKGPISCPADFGATYHLKFMNGSKVIANADADPAGCQGIVFNGTWKTAMSPVGQTFWTDLQKALNLDNNALEGIPNLTSTHG